MFPCTQQEVRINTSPLVVTSVSYMSMRSIVNFTQCVSLFAYG